MKLDSIKTIYQDMVQPKDNGDAEFIIPSGQFWHNLTPKEQAELTQIVALNGGDIEDYLHQMRVMLPKTPQGK